MVASNPHTYFFREPAGLQVIQNTVLSPAAKAGRSVAIWSAGCATGEEPVSLAILAHEAGASVELVGTDVNPEAIGRATKGRYDAHSLRHVEAKHRKRWFVAVGGGAYEVAASLRQTVRFQVQDFLSGASPKPSRRADGLWDVILCRNALIYYEPADVARAVAGFAASLAEHGLLMLGACEWLDARVYLHLGQSRVVEACEREGTVCYRKVPPPTRLGSASKSASRAHAHAPAAKHRRSDERRGGDDLLDAGRVAEALACYRKVLASNELVADLHLRVALCLLLQDASDAAREALRRSLFLEPELWPAAILLGDLVATEDPVLATRCYRQALDSLSGAPQALASRLGDYEFLEPFLMPQGAALEAVRLRLLGLCERIKRRG